MFKLYRNSNIRRGKSCALQYIGETSSTIILGNDMGWGAKTTTIINGKVGIGIGTPNTKSDVNEKINTNRNYGGLNTLQFGSFGGTGDKIITWAGIM